jgi:uncharacterized membrane protein required for colicin V production
MQSSILSTNISVFYALDLIALVYLLISTIVCAKKGFVRCLFGFITSVLAIVLAFVYADELLEASKGLWGLGDKLETGIVKKLSGLKGFNVDVSAAGLEASLKDVNLPQFIVDSIVKEFGHTELEVGMTVAMLAGAKIASLIVLLLCGVVLFFGIKIIGKILGLILGKAVNKIPLIGGLNRLLGALVGALKAFVIVCLILSVLSLIPSAGVTSFMDKTFVLGKLFHSNPLGKLLSLISI